MKNLISLFKAKTAKLVSRLRASPLPNLILLGLVVRFLLAPFSSDPNDIQVLHIVTNNLFAGLNIYTTNSFSYPPLWMYIEFPAFRLASFLASPKLLGARVNTLNISNEAWKLPQIITSPLFNVLCKLPLIAADLLIGLIIYGIVKEKRDEKIAKISFILWFLNPLVIGIVAVQGQFDVLPTLMTVLSFCLFFKRNYFASGIAIGLGALFKIYPVFLVPLYLFSVAAMEIKEVSVIEKVKAVFAGCLKFVMGMLVSASLFLVPLINSNLIHDVFSRAQLITSFGGLSPFCIVLLPWLEGLNKLLIDYSMVVSLSLLIICLAVIVFIGFVSSQGRKDFLKAFVFAHIAVIFTIYMTSLVVNPQYALWVLPFLVLSYGLYRDNYRKIHAFSTAALLFLVGLHGSSLFYPLSAYTPLTNPQTMLHDTQFFQNVIGWEAQIVGSFLGLATSILCLRGSIVTLLKIKKAEMSNSLRQEESGNDKPCLKLPKVSPSKILTAFFVFLILGQSLALIQPLTNRPVTFEVLSYEKNTDNIRINYRVKSGNFPTDVQIIATTSVTTQPIVDREILIYHDNDYPSLAGLKAKAAWIGLLDHIPIELQLRNYQNTTKIVNAADLRHEMQTNFDSIIIIPSGIFPATVHAANESMVGDWIRAGGTLIWMGDAFGHYSGYSGDVVRLFSTESYASSQNQTLGFVLFSENSTENRGYATKTTDFADALDLRYPLASYGACVSQISSHGGITLGKTTESENPRTSIAYVPVGLGKFILFGGGVERPFSATGEDVIAHDIAQILCSSVLFSGGTITYNLHELNIDESREGDITVLTPIRGEIRILVAVFSKSPYVYYFSRTIIDP